MKIAWIVSGPFGSSSSYYQQTHLFADHLNKLGYESRIIHFTSPEKDAEGVLNAIKDYHPEVLITFGDHRFINLSTLTGLPVISWTINGTGVVPLKSSVPNTTFACVSKFAHNLYQKAGIEPLAYFPHGFDPNIFNTKERKSARNRLGWNHTTPTVLMLSTNYVPSPHESPNTKLDRKNWAGGLKAFKKLLIKRPDTKLFIHSNAYGAVDLSLWIEKLNIKDSVMLSDQKYYTDGNWNRPHTYVADLYKASNALLFPSLSEGFGIPSIEAQACGTPVVTTKAGPMTELALTGTAVESTNHPAFPAWRTPKISALAEALDKWLDYDKPQKASRLVRSLSVNQVIENHFLNLLSNI
jgi:glycosyltransferase involved in cell wall biosynthesis